jgi:hypothetical protein
MTLARRKPTDFVQQADVVCPFYMEHANHKYSYLTCEGAIETATMVSRFRKSSDMAVHMRKHCCKLGAYLGCPIYKIVAQKYEEDI